MESAFSFEEIGLETRDKRVYEALAANPQSSLRKIATITGINRGSVYESIKKLAEQGLVSMIDVGKQHHYSCSNPETIIELLKERQQKAQNAERLAATYITSLAKPVDQPETLPFATFYQDDEGVAAILRDVITTCSALRGKPYRVISTRRIRQYLYHNYPNFTQRRIAEKIDVRVISVGGGGERDARSERKWLDVTLAKEPNCYTIIYGNKTAFISMNEENVLSGIVIDNEGVANLQKELFELIWRTL